MMRFVTICIRSLQKPKSLQLYNQIGNFWRVKGDASKAIECFRRSLAVSPNNAEVGGGGAGLRDRYFWFLCSVWYLKEVADSLWYFPVVFVLVTTWINNRLVFCCRSYRVFG